MKRAVILLSILALGASGGTDEIAFEIGNSHDLGASGLDTFIGDFDGDGLLDVGIANRDERKIILHINQGDGSLVASELSTGHWNFSNVRPGDLNGDGRDDLVTSGQRPGGIWAFGLFLSNGSGGYEQTWTETDQWEPSPPMDFDGDGDLDILGIGEVDSTFRYLWNDGAGNFTADEPFAPEGEPGYPDLGDLDGDGRPEWIANLADGLGYMKNLGNGRFGPAVILFPSIFRRSTVADFDGDSHLDVMAFVSTQTIGYADPPPGLFLRRGRGDGTFDPVEHLDIATTDGGSGGAGLEIWAFDFDDDGDIDLATHGSTSNRLSLLPNPGDGRFDSASEFAFYGSGEAPMPIHVVAGELNGVEGTDLVVQLWTGGVRFLVKSDVPPPVITETTPATVTGGDTVTFTIRGTGFHPDCTVPLNRNLTLESLTWVDSGHLQATVRFPPIDIHKPLGIDYDLAVENPSGASARAERALHCAPDYGVGLRIHSAKIKTRNTESDPSKIRLSGTIDPEDVDRLFAEAGATHISIYYGDPTLRGLAGRHVPDHPRKVKVNRKRTRISYHDPRTGIHFVLRRNSKKKQFKLVVKDKHGIPVGARVFLAFQIGDAMAYGEADR